MVTRPAPNPQPSMKSASNPVPQDDDLSAVLDKIERDVASAFQRQPDALWGLLALLFVVIVSPMVVFWVWGPWIGREWSETVKNAVQSLAIVAAAFGICKWLEERRNRATDVLLALDKEFKKKPVMDGRKCVEDGDYEGEARSDKLDDLLRFYVLLYGVFRAKQVPEVSLSICFRYWLAFYFRVDRPGFRFYIDRSYPTLSKWLRDDCRKGLQFFRPKQLFADKVDQEFIDRCGKGE